MYHEFSIEDSREIKKYIWYLVSAIKDLTKKNRHINKLIQ